MEFAKSFLTTALTLFVGLLIFVYAWMTIFVHWLGYDYVTTSSVLFVFLVFTNAFWAVVALVRTKGVGGALPAIVGFFLYPLVFSTALGVYEAHQAPVLSDAVSAVAWYRGLIAVPVGALQTGIAQLGPVFASALKAIDASPLLTQIVASLSVAAITACITMFTGARRVRA